MIRKPTIALALLLVLAGCSAIGGNQGRTAVQNDTVQQICNNAKDNETKTVCAAYRLQTNELDDVEDERDRLQGELAKIRTDYKKIRQNKQVNRSQARSVGLVFGENDSDVGVYHELSNGFVTKMYWYVGPNEGDVGYKDAWVRIGKITEKELEDGKVTVDLPYRIPGIENTTYVAKTRGELSNIGNRLDREGHKHRAVMIGVTRSYDNRLDREEQTGSALNIGQFIWVIAAFFGGGGIATYRKNRGDQSFVDKAYERYNKRKEQKHIHGDNVDHGDGDSFLDRFRR